MAVPYREVMTTRGLRCARCGYDISVTLKDGLLTCPECGATPCEARVPVPRHPRRVRLLMIVLCPLPVVLVPLVTWHGSLWLSESGLNPIHVRPSWVAVPAFAKSLVPWAWVMAGVILFTPWFFIERRRRRERAGQRAMLVTLASLLVGLAFSGELVGRPWVRQLTHEALLLRWCPTCQ